MNVEGADAGQLLAMLEKVTKTSELFQRKNAEQEKVNDRLRLENVQLHQTVEDLTDDVHTLKEQLSEQGKQNEHLLTKQGTFHSSRDDISTGNPVEEVKTLRKVKKQLEKQLNASQSTTLNFQASFQEEFDLRAQIEQKLEELRERYERMITENDQLRLILKAHNITAPSPPGLRSMPGSRKKKHAPKSRPLTMYSDLSDYNGSVTHSSKRAAKTKSTHIKKAPSLGSLLDGKISTQAISTNSKNSTIDGEGGTVVMAETAQVEVVKEMSASGSSKDTTQPQELGTSKEPESQNQNDVSTKQTPNGEKGDELLPPLECSRTDTLMWNAKGFLSRIEKLADSGEGGGRMEREDKTGKKPAKSERDEHELKEMMSSVSVKQLESAKAFLEASQRCSPECPENV